MKILYILLLSTLILSADKIQEDKTKQAIVKIYTTAKVPNYQEPWSSSMRSSTGSGSIIEGGYILTNAHVVANEVFIEVQRYGERKRYIAEVYAVSHQADLALLRVKKKQFFKGVKPLGFGSLPEVEQKIVVYGYPMGGSTLSATIGVVSRVEHHAYVHSGEGFLAVQVDAAVNPGNSGGPALSNGKIVGVVMQVIKKSQNIGYLVPINMVKHFIDDMKDGKYDGFADLGLTTQKLLNPAMRRYYKIDDNSSGKLIDKVAFSSPLYGVIKGGDVLSSVNGHKVQNDGTVEFRRHEYTHYQYFIDEYQMGESVKLGIIRDGKKIEIETKLKTKTDDILLVDTTHYDRVPSYFIYGGYIFSPLTRNLIRTTKRNRLNLSYLSSQSVDSNQTQKVVLLKVLASDMSRGDNNFGMWPIDTINGEGYVNFKDFYNKVTNSNSKYIFFKDNEDGIRVVIDRQEALAKQPDILKKYNIEFDKSIDLRKESK